MFTFLLPARTGGRTCDGSTRRNFLAFGSTGILGLGLPDWFGQTTRAAPPADSPGNRSTTFGKAKGVITIWLGGGPSHVETWDPKMTAPAEFRSMTGETPTSVPGITLGKSFTKLARIMPKLAVVRSLTHGNSGHSGGTHWLMTGRNHAQADNNLPPIWPSIGSMISRYYGASSPSGVPTYVAQDDIYAGGPAWLGANFGAFNGRGEARANLRLNVTVPRLSDRRTLLTSFDSMRKEVDQTGVAAAMDGFADQAFGALTRDVGNVFNLSAEDPRLRDRYGRTTIGDQLVLSRRLIEGGAKYVSLHFGGWDMHGGLVDGFKQLGPQLDSAVAALIDDLDQRGLLEETMVIVTGEFGRTPRINGTAGRDHWPQLSSLMVAGGGLQGGVVVGESSAKAEYPKLNPVTPSDLVATVLYAMGIPVDTQFRDSGGRPQYLVDGGKPIAALI